jgi:hypothetical protein
MIHVQGGCLCGKVRYTVSGDVIFSGVCHCTSCKKSTGSAFSAVFAVPSPAVQVSGELSTYVGQGDSGNATTKRFCPNCGSQVFGEAAIMPDVTMVDIGTLDEPASVPLQMHIYCRSKLDWVQVPEGIGAFETMPTGP